MSTVLVLGVGGTSRDIADMVAETMPEAKLVYLDDNSPGEVIDAQTIADASRYPDALCICGIGSVRSYLRKPEIIARTKLPRERFLTVIHPQAYVHPEAQIGRGCAVFPGAYIGRCKIGDHVVVLPNAILSHDVSVGDYCCIAGGVCLSGDVIVGECCYLGSSCVVDNDVTIADGSLVGMGAVVTHDVESDTVVVGNPARYLREAK